MKLFTILRSVWIALAVWIVAPVSAYSATRHVVILFDERPELPGLEALDSEFANALTSNSKDRIELYRESMDLSRFGSKTYESFLRDALRTKFSGKKIDVVVAFLGPALEFLLNHGNEIFPGTPIVFCGVDQRELTNRSLPPQIRGVVFKRAFAPTVDIALKLHPQTVRIAVVAGSSEFDNRLLAQARQEFHAYENRLTFTYLNNLPLEKLLAELGQLPPQTIVLFSTLFKDGAGETFIPHDVVALVSAAANAPLYGFLDQYLGRGIVGGNLYSTSAQGVAAAKLVLQVLADPRPQGNQLVEASSHVTLFDWRQMRRWGISESSLPAGSEVRFHDLNVWEQYRVPIFGSSCGAAASKCPCYVARL